MAASVIESRGIVGDWKEHSTGAGAPEPCATLCGTGPTCAAHALVRNGWRRSSRRTAARFPITPSPGSGPADLFDLRQHRASACWSLPRETAIASHLPAMARETAPVPRKRRRRSCANWRRAPSPRIQEADDATAAKLVRDGWRIRGDERGIMYPRGELADRSGNRYEKKRQSEPPERGRSWRWRAFGAGRPADGPVALRRVAGERTAAHPGEFYAAQAEASGGRCIAG